MNCLTLNKTANSSSIIAYFKDKYCIMRQEPVKPEKIDDEETEEIIKNSTNISIDDDIQEQDPIIIEPSEEDKSTMEVQLTGQTSNQISI